MPKKRTYTFQIDSYIGYPITAQWVKQQLQACGDKPVTVLINSLGGDLDTALSIRQQFIDHGDVTVLFTGFCASAATILAMGAKHISMSRHALILVHQCLGYSETWGYFNRDQLKQAIADLKKQQSDLDTIDRVVASIYADRSGTDPKQMAALMAEERWLTADEALELGLIDAIDEDEQDQDAASQKLTATARAHFAACGLPLPYGDDASQRRNQEAYTSDHRSTPQPHWLATLIQSLRDLLHPQTNTTNTITNTTMEQTTITAPHISAALQAESITATDGKVTLTAEQLTTIEATIAALKEATAKAEADREEAIRARDEATARAEAAQAAQAKAEATLAAADGADTEQATPTASEDSPIQAGITAANFFAQFGASM